ncbi:bifunctional diguanylate cyclase/phosphodiesterase [Pseudogulbenkiania sp. MAI-1]|uniref:putative bifunctional diguanylate cyclase/phosphodiesterase n=1 Tax=Pseudogulbenkiania sp. MAI-1 TaxID=990370 RepID=UPI0004ACB510|nr:bifunctional diguanylate cyclase/phosphodiesterase [Pseudogulbenkiania sp. MAI-1]
MAIPRELTPSELELLNVFALSVSGGLHNVSLLNRLDKMAYEDDLTPLPNRNALVRALDFAMEAPQRAGRGLLLLDIDGFSGINIAFGPGYGNDILRRVAVRLRHSLDATVFIARVGKDIFALLGQIERIHPDLVRAVLNGGADADDPLKVLTLGTALVPLDTLGGRGEGVLELAGLALKRAKLRGHGQHEIYHPDLEKAAAESFRLLERTRQAVEGDRLYVEFQPQIDLRSGTVHGVEALARLYDEHGAPLSPDAVIPLTETTGLILEMGERIFAQSCQAAKALAMAGFAMLKVAVNLSVVQLVRPEQMERVLARLASTGIEPEQLEIEVTESVAMLNFDAVRAQLQRFQFLGLSVAIDDFGTGFSSLAYLSQLPADRLKIDRRFVGELGRGEEAEAIADMVIKLAIRLGKTVVAEGVETGQQARWLHAHGCHYAQGYHYARPMPLAALLAWLERRRVAEHIHEAPAA